MSLENDKTVEIYKENAIKYMESSNVHDNIDPDKAKRKQEKLHNFLKESLQTIPKGSKIIEIGSADGVNAKYIESLGFNITASDVAEAFISACKDKKLKTINFNIIDDDFREKYNAIFAWRVFVHFTKNDIVNILQKTYNALENGGIFIFNVINRETKNIDQEWIDFSNEYHMGAERFYKYFTKDELDEIIKNTFFKIQSFHKEGGNNQNKWLVYVLKK